MKKDELNTLVICKKCHTLHQKIKIHKDTKALCSYCNTVIYRHTKHLYRSTLALTFTALILLVVAFSFDIITININGTYKSLNLQSLFIVVFQQGYYLVGIMLLFLIVIFPLAILVSIILLLILMHIKKAGYTVKRLLILIAKLQHWSMIDIFFISILVSMVKLFAYAQIELGISFFSFILLLILDIIIVKKISFNELWILYERIYVTHKDKKV
ncbi:MAG: paraquat-inducible protein A [Sulfurovaceae bacterium]|nr:paraquat-inducible protein A [Sulfurovaceae bacterium]